MINSTQRYIDEIKRLVEAVEGTQQENIERAATQELRDKNLTPEIGNNLGGFFAGRCTRKNGKSYCRGGIASLPFVL